MKYNHKELDKKWQDRFEESGVFDALDVSEKPKFFCLVEFPYPSGNGLHMGHPRSYTAMDVVARKRRAQGYNVLYPIGWDAFGLPTENYAIKHGRKPQDVTRENVANFRRQLKSLGLSFDWSREVNTTDPSYYKWTQWMFLEFFDAGLAYKKGMAINWCVSCKIGLANEEVVGGVCERCGGVVEKRDKEQWMIAITKYADRLIDDLDGLDYLEKIAKQQRDWIGRSEGALVEFVVDGMEDLNIEVFTTRPDTLFGATYVVLAPEHELVGKIVGDDERDGVEAYVAEARRKSDFERGDDGREKTGVFTGAYVLNPVNGERLPVWVADYVLIGYGTGAIMAVPGHDERDFAFAKAFGLEIRQVVIPSLEYASAGDTYEESLRRNNDREKEVDNLIAGNAFFDGEGIVQNSGFLDGLGSLEAKGRMIEWLEENGVGEGKVNYRLRDWVFSRQRYWGEPIPLVKCASGCGADRGGWVPVPLDELPLELPDVDRYEPTDYGESPLAGIDEWVNTKCPQCGGPGVRETDTMPNWAGSSWYFLRYIDPHNDDVFADAEKLKYWMPVDWYNGGMEHTTLHLLYSRFWNKFLADRGHVPVTEPYQKRTSHGLILAADGTKMSKSKGNAISPDGLVEQYGADVVRLAELFVGPFAEPVPWKDDGMRGMARFLDRVVGLVDLVVEDDSDEILRALNKMVKGVGEDIEEMRFNTAVSKMMIFVNVVIADGGLSVESLNTFLVVLSGFAPHVAEEVFERVGGGEIGMVCEMSWPEYDEAMTVDALVTIGVQVNGKVRGEVSLSADAGEEEARAAAFGEVNVARYLEGVEVKKFVYVAGRIISIVV